MTATAATTTTVLTTIQRARARDLVARRMLPEHSALAISRAVAELEQRPAPMPAPVVSVSVSVSSLRATAKSPVESDFSALILALSSELTALSDALNRGDDGGPGFVGGVAGLADEGRRAVRELSTTAAAALGRVIKSVEGYENTLVGQIQRNPALKATIEAEIAAVRAWLQNSREVYARIAQQGR